MTALTHDEITPKLVEGLHAEAMALAGAARRYFDTDGAEERAGLDPLARMTFSTEALKVTTRLMQVVAWLMVRKAVEAGDLTPEAARAPGRRLGGAAAADGAPEGRTALLPKRARRLVAGSVDLYDRVRRLDTQMVGPVAAEGGGGSGARALLDRLRASM